MNFDKNITKERFEDVMNRFDFVKVNKVMKLLNWTWGGTREVPSTVEMEMMCYSLLADLLDHLKYTDTDYPFTCSSGGFEVIVNEIGEPSLRFIVERQDWYPGETSDGDE
jgi:hypothetical protein